MKYLLYVLLVSALFGGCRNPIAADVPEASGSVIEYSVAENVYAVVVVLDGISRAQAKKVAIKRAAEVTVMNGYRYFQIESEEDTRVIKGSGPGFGGNMYEEQIALKNFGRDQLDREFKSSQSFPAIRLSFGMYQDKPKGKYIDSCTLTPCDL